VEEVVEDIKLAEQGLL